MSVPSPVERRRFPSTCSAAALMLVLLIGSIPFNTAADDIPHENYDLVGTDLDFVIQLLRSSISYSEFALMAMYNESMNDVNQNLSVVQGLLVPAEQLLNRIRNIAASYENLSVLIPPFSDLSAGMSSFASDEVKLLADRDNIVSASILENLTGEAMTQALAAIKEFNSLITRMNSTIDEMLISADSILNLTVDQDRPFTDNQLIPLIEALRDLLKNLRLEVNEIIHNDVPWNQDIPFLILWVSDDSYYLGESIVGGGLLYYEGGFQEDKTIGIVMDGFNLTVARTVAGGEFSFSYPIPLDSAWLGIHTMRASAPYPNGTLWSDPIQFSIVLIPTTMSLRTNGSEFAITDEIAAEIRLEDSSGKAIASASCRFLMDGGEEGFLTDDNGSYVGKWETSELGYGIHRVQAFFDGELPYAACSSNSATFTVDVPTNITVQLFSSRFLSGYSVIGNGTLKANGTEPLSDQEIVISVDGVAMANVTTGAQGEFSFSITTKDMKIGGHVLKAELLNRDQVWRYSSDTIGFNVIGQKVASYPFFPWMPGWGGIYPPENAVYFLIGPNAYIFWLLLLTLIAVSVKVFQIKKNKSDAAKLATTDLVVAIDESPYPAAGPALSAEELATELAKAAESPATPNERIVLYYQRLLSFLARKGRVMLKTSMTHWEVARLLNSLGYPTRSVETVTVLFERAFYSESKLTDEDTVVMSASITGLITNRAKGGTANAV